MKIIVRLTAKHLHNILLLILISFNSFSMEVKLSDFNIKPSNKNNTEGFLNLSKWLKGKNDITINFQKGIYYMGLQKKSNVKVIESIINIFSIEECSNVKIVGNGATIKFVDNLMFGSFDIKTKAKLTHQTTFLKGENAAYPGNCIYINKCRQVTISNLTLDGNCERMIIGGRYGDLGIQLSHRGIYVMNSIDVSLNRLYIHHFGLDGIEISNKSLDLGKSKYQTQISAVKSYYNGRQGISWTGGNGLYIINSEFCHTGKANVFSKPGCGIDIEPELNKCINGYFINCKFENNGGYAFGSDYFTKPIQNIEFQKCIFGGTTAGALFPSNGGVTIDNCIIYGQIVRPSGLSQKERVLITNCSIYDYNPNNFSFPKFASNHLVDAGGHRTFFDFVNCRFYLKKVKFCYVETGQSEEANFPTFKNNKIYFNYTTFLKNDFLTVFRSCTLNNNEFIIDNNFSKNNGNFLYYSGIKNIGVNRITGNNLFVGWNSSAGPKVIPE